MSRDQSSSLRLRWLGSVSHPDPTRPLMGYAALEDRREECASPLTVVAVAQGPQASEKCPCCESNRW